MSDDGMDRTSAAIAELQLARETNEDTIRLLRQAGERMQRVAELITRAVGATAGAAPLAMLARNREQRQEIEHGLIGISDDVSRMTAALQAAQRKGNQ